MKKMISLILVLALALCMVPVFAEEEAAEEDGKEKARQLSQYAAAGQILHIIHVNRSLPFTKRGALYSAHAEKARG